jgi:hypothetical protein
MSKLGWLMGWSTRDMWAGSLYFLHVVFGSICKPFASFQHILWHFTYGYWANFDFSGRNFFRLYFFSPQNSQLKVETSDTLPFLDGLVMKRVSNWPRNYTGSLLIRVFICISTNHHITWKLGPLIVWSIDLRSYVRIIVISTRKLKT